MSGLDKLAEMGLSGDQLAEWRCEERKRLCRAEMRAVKSCFVAAGVTLIGATAVLILCGIAMYTLVGR